MSVPDVGSSRYYWKDRQAVTVERRIKPDDSHRPIEPHIVWLYLSTSGSHQELGYARLKRMATHLVAFGVEHYEMF